jgi:hypothetical protein
MRLTAKAADAKTKYLEMKIYWFKLSYFLLVFGVACLFFISNFKTPFRNSSSVDVVKVLNSLPESDRKSLEGFFRCLYRDAFPYVLFGNKPMAIFLFLKIEPYHPPIYPIDDFLKFSVGLVDPERVKAYRGWETWKKYKHLFPSSNFVLLENQDSEYITVVMINKKSFLKKIEENIDDFREVLGAQITPEKILKNCLETNDVFKDALNGNEGLFGMLLGFGRHNSRLFLRRNQIEKIIKSQKLLSTKQPLPPSNGFSTIEEEYQHINERLTFFHNAPIIDFNPLLITLPRFAADHDHPETQQLEIEYMKQYKDITKRYKKGDFLEITLEQLTRNNR